MSFTYNKFKLAHKTSYIRGYLYFSTPSNVVGNKNLTKLNINNSYIELVSSVLYTMKTKDHSTLTEILSNNNIDVLDDDINISLDVKRFCSNTRIFASSPFDKNILEILLMPLSRSLVLEEKALYLKKEYESNMNNYKRLISNDAVRESCLKYVHSVFQDSEGGLITAHTTLRSFQKDEVMREALKELKDGELTQSGRHILLSAFIEVVMFEIVHGLSPNSKRSKSKILNYLIDRLAKS